MLETLLGSAPGYDLTKIVLQRSIALVYLMAFLAAAFQFKALLGEHGLLPIQNFVKNVSFNDSPSLFFFIPKDIAFTICAWLGVGVSLLALFGVTERFGSIASACAWALLWVLYLSFVNVGQTFYSFGWESILLEAGFLAIFMGGASTGMPVIVLWLYRWLLFRIMFGAGLIKLRGDTCWKDLTCLFYHFETQPMPNPLSWYFHWLPRWMLKGGVLYNHLVELIVPFAYILPRPWNRPGAILTILFHLFLFVSGNFAWLNFMTLVLSFSLIDDGIWTRILPMHVAHVAALPAFHQYAVILLGIVMAVLSLQPIRNMFSRNQVMNTSYDAFHLMGSYGAFGSITRPRYEIELEGTMDDTVTDKTTWKAYGFKGKPGELDRLPPQIAPYHLRLDWLMWFAGFSNGPGEHPWIVHLVSKLLKGDAATLDLLRSSPFPKPPHFIRATRYEYHFTTPSERAKTGDWWTREEVGPYLPPLSLDDKDLASYMALMGWKD